PVLRDRGSHKGRYRPPRRGAGGGARVIQAHTAVRLRRHHGARWNEPIIMEQGQPGERGIYPPKSEPELAAAVGQPQVPDSVRRRQAPKLPELSQYEVLRHFLRLSQEVRPVDLGIAVGEGTCTVKYNPRINEWAVRLTELADLHPLQPDQTVQGILQVY